MHGHLSIKHLMWFVWNMAQPKTNHNTSHVHVSSKKCLHLSARCCKFLYQFKQLLQFCLASGFIHFKNCRLNCIKIISINKFLLADSNLELFKGLHYGGILKADLNLQDCGGNCVVICGRWHSFTICINFSWLLCCLMTKFNRILHSITWKGHAVWMERPLEGKVPDRLTNAVLIFACRDWRKSWGTSLRITGGSADIATGKVPDKGLRSYMEPDPVGSVFSNPVDCANIYRSHKPFT
jgi:hypothetical protein